MSSFSFVEEGAIDEINSMIKSLPSSEEIDKLGSGVGQLKKLKEHIGGIMQLIETYGKRDMESKVRYKARTGLPPRYKVLDWTTMKQKAFDLSKQLIRVSSLVDKKGQKEAAYKLIVAAKKIRKYIVLENQINKEALNKKTSLTKESAQGYLGGFFDRMKKDVGGKIGDWAKGGEIKSSEIQVANLSKKMQNLVAEIQGVMEGMKTMIEKYTGEDKETIVNLSNALSYLAGFGSKAYISADRIVKKLDVVRDRTQQPQQPQPQQPQPQVQPQTNQPQAQPQAQPQVNYEDPQLSLGDNITFTDGKLYQVKDDGNGNAVIETSKGVFVKLVVEPNGTIGFIPPKSVAKGMEQKSLSNTVGFNLSKYLKISKKNV